jgi:hypothetical protein
MNDKAGAPAPGIGFASPAPPAVPSRRIPFLAPPRRPRRTTSVGEWSGGGPRLRPTSLRAPTDPSGRRRPAPAFHPPTRPSSAVQIQFTPGKENGK